MDIIKCGFLKNIHGKDGVLGVVENLENLLEEVENL